MMASQSKRRKIESRIIIEGEQAAEVAKAYMSSDEQRRNDPVYAIFLYPVAHKFLGLLKLGDLKNARLVCKLWEEISMESFYSKSAIKICYKYAPLEVIDSEYKDFYSNSCIRNLKLKNFVVPLPLTSSDEVFCWKQLNELTIAEVRFKDCHYVLRCLCILVPNLSHLKLFCDSNSPPALGAAKKFPHFPNFDAFPRKLQSFSLQIDSFEIEEAEGRGHVIEFVKYLRLCPDLKELQLDFRLTYIPELFLCEFLRLKYNAPLSYNLTTLKISTLFTDSDLSLDASERLLHYVGMYCRKFPLKELQLSFNTGTGIIPWSNVIQNLPMSLEKIKIKAIFCCDRPENISFAFGSSSSSRLKSLDVNLWKVNGRLKPLEKQIHLENLLEFNLIIPSSSHMWDFPRNLASSCHSLKRLCVTVNLRDEFVQIVLFFKQLEDFEIYIRHHWFTTKDVIVHGADERRVDEKTFRGVCKMQELRRLSLSPCLNLNDECVSGFLLMPKLQILEIFFGIGSVAQKNKISEAGINALKARHIYFYQLASLPSPSDPYRTVP